ncbi:MAG TPA: HYR domain-containing protein, partial [Bacteroidia bacterium]|nr:HYR domain-containing protein [Bacteroidia bacterium]
PAIGTGAWSIIIGAGGTVTTPSSPTSGFTGVIGTTYVLRWTISNAPCVATTDDVMITLRANPTTANAGPDQAICGTTATLAGNTPTFGTGSWSIITGAGGSVTLPSSPTSGFTGLAGTTYTLRWTISNAPCTASTDDVVITLAGTPTTANAGPDQNVCAASATLAANTPATGTGAWSIVSGTGGTVTTPTSPTSTFTGTSGTTYTLRWTISNAPCTASSDDVLITITAGPTTANAGPDQTLCASSATLAANTPTMGTGAWSIISGAGGTVTTPASPTSGFTGVAGTTYTLRWTISSAPCAPSTDDVVITLRANPTTANAGPDQTICGSSGSLAANTPTVGTGAWTIVSGAGGTVTTPSSPTSAFTGVAGTTYTFRWTISNAPCTASTDDVVITLRANPTTANAGPDQTICGSSATLAGNTPTVGAGAWTIVSGAGGTVTTPGSGTSAFTGLAGTAYTLRWTISNAPCTASIDDVVITFTNNPTTANAGPDQTICGTSTTLAANTPTVGTGAWSIVSGTGGSVTTPGSPTSAFTAVAGQVYTLRWTVTNPPCAPTFDDVVITTDIVAPAITCPANATLNNDAGLCAAVATYAAPVGTDNCPSATTTQTAGLASGASFPVGTTTNTFRVTDASGLTATCSFTVTVVDAEVPAITCPANISASTDVGVCTAVVTYATPAGTDNCPSSTTSQTAGLASGAIYPSGATTNTFQVTDGAGNATTCSFTITVTDTTSPNAICQNITLYLDNTGTATTTAAAVNNGSTDNCAVDSLFLSQTTFGCGDVGANVEGFVAFDANGNDGICLLTITVEDTFAPVANCQNFTVQLDVNGTGAATASDVNNGSTDPCGILNLSLSQGQFFCAEVGANTEVLTVTDINNNTSTCNAIITVEDNVAPVANCQDATVQLDNTGNGSITSGAIDNGSTDACGIASMVLSQSAFTCAHVGSNSVSLVITDVNGNTSSCTKTVTVQDNVSPLAICQNITVQLDNGGNGTANAADVNNGSSDACGIQTLSLNVSAFTCNNTGSNSVTLTVTDPNGNTSNCSATVTVEDNVAPVAICQNVTVQLDGSGNGSTNANAINNGSSDACGVGNVSLSGNSFTCASLGANTATLTVTDINGNSSTCSATVTVVDLVAPAIICPANQTLTAGSNCEAAATWTAPSATDNCSMQSVTGSDTSGTSFPIGINTVTYTATDGSGNTNTCTFTITVNGSPLIVTATSPLQGCGFHLACAGDLNAVVTGNVSGGCLPYNYLWSTGATTPNLSGLGAGTVSLTVTDGAGSTGVTSFIVTAPTPLVTSVSGDTIQCAGSNAGSLTVSASGGQTCAAYSYLWSNGATTATVTGLGAGSYTVTVTDASGCTSTATHTIQTGAAAVLNLGPDVSTCPGVPVTLQAGNTFNTYAWSTGGTTSSITVSTPGTYSLTVTSVDGCSDADTLQVNQFVVDNNIITANGSLSLCPGDTVELQGDAGLSSYLWSTGATTQSIFVSGAGGAITLSATDANGCSVSDTVTVDFHPFTEPTPVITPGPSVVLCDGESRTLDVGNFYATYLWSTGATTQTISVTTAGTYQVTVANAFGCTEVSAPVTVTTAPAPTPVVVNNSGVLSTTQSYSTYQWLLNGNQLPGVTTPTYTPALVGWYSVSVTDANGCVGTSDSLLYDPIGVADGVEALNGLQLYPNPSMGTVNLRALSPIDWPMTVEIWDMFGKKLHVYEMAHLMDVASFDLSDIAAGPYLMKITSFQRNKTQQAVIRFVIE